MNRVRSKDGTAIAWERSGSGPALIVVDGALCSRAFGPSRKIAARLAEHFTVYIYDRRGRGESSDTGPYSPAREVEDLNALIVEAGGSAALLGLSSGAALALEAAASRLPITHVVAYEPPYVDDAGTRGGSSHQGALAERVAHGDRGSAVTYFMKDMVGVPAPAVIMMRMMPWVWPKLKAVAHTLPYDAAIMTSFQIPRRRFASIDTPVLVMNGSKTDARLKEAARAIAHVVPEAQHFELAGQTHNVSADALGTAVIEFIVPRRHVAASRQMAGNRQQVTGDRRQAVGRRRNLTICDCAHRLSPTAHRPFQSLGESDAVHHHAQDRRAL
jgi:pimeloyl-ACP methyl ester carboxylesterase